MDEPAIEIPGLERLMRDVLRAVCASVLGPDWLGGLSKSVADPVATTAVKARDQRPHEALADDWDAAGIAEISALVRSKWADIGAALAPVWTKTSEAEVDLARLLTYRGRALHEVGQVNFAAQRAETAASITRLRLAFEAVRRSLLPTETNWMPYLERIESPILGLCWARGAASQQRPTLRQGDLVELRLIGVNPSGDQDDLRYDIEITGVTGPRPEVRCQAPNEFSFDAPRSKEFIVSCYVRDVNDPTMYDGQAVVAPSDPGPTIDRRCVACEGGSVGCALLDALGEAIPCGLLHVVGITADVLNAALQDCEVLLDECLVALGHVLGEIVQVLLDVAPVLGRRGAVAPAQVVDLLVDVGDGALSLFRSGGIAEVADRVGEVTAVALGS
jgi:hypothetical protein